MSKRLPEDLEASDLKMARLRKERRAFEARGMQASLPPINLDVVEGSLSEDIQAIEDFEDTVSEEMVKKDIKKTKAVKSVRGGRK